MKYGFLVTMLVLFTLSCSGTRHNVEKTNLESHPKTTIPPELIEAHAYIPMGKNAEQINDTLGAEFYFGKAMELVTNFQQTHPEIADSAAQQIVEEVSLEYAKYLARLNGIEEDTLTAANVMKLLSSLEDSLEKPEDSTLVTIPDVIEGEGVMPIPLVLNQKVERAIQYFQGRGRRVFTKWLQRSGWYRPLIERILKEEGVPAELFYLAMIESGFNPRARSYARAVGMWQFIYRTGQAYGLNQSWWYDERQDPEKSTRAAARHLKDLYNRFNNWYLAIAGYNYSPRKIERRIQRYGVNEFWDLPRLPRQTRNYVPTFIAAALIAQNPEKYGFYVEPEPVIEFDTVTVRECVDLNVVAECVDSDFATIKKLNPALLRFCTPPDRESWVLNIPKGTREQFLENYAKVPDEQKMTWVHHRIRSGETLSTIARKYGVSMSEIKRFNKIRGSLIRAGHSLVIPVPQNKSYARQLARNSADTYSTPRARPVSNVPGRVKHVHTVQKGQTLWEISQIYGVSLSQLRQWNGLSYYSRIIRPGQKLNVWLPEDSEKAAEPEQLASRNAPEQVENNNSSDQGNTIEYIVRRGDTLWDIANRHGVSIRDIKRWNNRRSNLIKPGDVLKIVVQ
ncbi:MAG: hypothetical protein Kow0042_01020 [Calditrichia bacterium]